MKGKTNIKLRPWAQMISEGDGGIFSVYCRTKDRALKEILDIWNDDLEYHKQEYGDQQITIDKLKEETGWRCRDCSFITISEPECCECMKTLYGRGLKIFTYYFQ